MPRTTRKQRTEQQRLPTGPTVSAMDQVLLQQAIRRATQQEEYTQLCAMTREQRQAAYAAGQLTGYQVRAWYGEDRFRGEQPLTSLNGTPGEFFHILCKTPEWLGE